MALEKNATNELQHRDQNGGFGRRLHQDRPSERRQWDVMSAADGYEDESRSSGPEIEPGK